MDQTTTLPLTDEGRSKLAKRAGLAAIVTAATLLLGKMIAYAVTGSLSILGGLTDSLLDLTASAMNYYAIRFAHIPADEDHRFGHGKAEALAGIAQAVLIAVSAILLLIKALTGSLDAPAPKDLEIGIAVFMFSVIATFALTRYQQYVVKRTGSPAVAADALHYKNDLYLNAGILCSLAVTHITGFLYVDTVFTIVIAGMIGYGAKEVIMSSLDQIMDKELPDENRKAIYDLLLSHPEIPDIHDLRTRSSGTRLFIQFHMELPAQMNLSEAHRISEEAEEILHSHFPHAEIFIHLDPHGHEQENPVRFESETI